MRSKDSFERANKASGDSGCGIDMNIILLSQSLFLCVTLQDCSIRRLEHAPTSFICCSLNKNEYTDAGSSLLLEGFSSNPR